MSGVLAIAKRILLQFAHDKRTLGLLFVAPMVVLWLLTVLLGSGDYEPRLACVDLPSSYQALLAEQDCTLQNTTSEEGEKLLRDNRVDAVLSMGEGQTLNIWAEGSDSTKTAACVRVAADAMADLADDATTRMKSDVDAKKAEIEELKARAQKKQDEIKALIEEKKSEIEAKKAEVLAKRDELIAKRDQVLAKKDEMLAKRSQIEQKQSEIASQISGLKDKQAKAQEQLKEKMEDLQGLIGQMAAALTELVGRLPEEEQEPYAELIEQMQAANELDLEELVKSMGTSTPNLDLDMGLGSDFDLDVDFDFDSAFDLDSIMDPDSLLDIDTDIEFPNTDDFSFDISEYLPVSEIQKTYLHGSDDWKMFDFYGPVFIGIFLFVFVFLTSGMSLVNERSAGTMERFLATPVRPAQVLGGYLIGFGLLAAVQATVVLWFALNVIGFPNEGSIALVVATVVLLALASVSLGLLVSGLASSAFQVIQLMLVFVVPQVLLSGLFDLSSAPQWLQALGKCFPVTYGVDALRAIMLRGATFQTIWFDLAIIAGFVTLFFVLASIGFRKKRARSYN